MPTITLDDDQLDRLRFTVTQAAEAGQDICDVLQILDTVWIDALLDEPESQEPVDSTAPPTA